MATSPRAVIWVVPVKEIWLVRERERGTRAEAFPTKEDAIERAKRLARARGDRPLVRIISRSGAFEQELAPAPRVVA